MPSHHCKKTVWTYLLISCTFIVLYSPLLCYQLLCYHIIIIISPYVARNTLYFYHRVGICKTKTTDWLYLKRPFKYVNQIFELYVNYCKNLIQKPLSNTFFSWYTKKKLFNTQAKKWSMRFMHFITNMWANNIYGKHINKKKTIQRKNLRYSYGRK